MPTLGAVFAALAAWKQPTSDGSPVRLACRIDAGATAAEIDSAGLGTMISDELIELWSTSRESWLFEDTEYGQWGLHLLSPGDSAVRSASGRAQRPDDLRADDVVLGEFLGDSELLVYAPSEPIDRRFLIALPLDPRADWSSVGSTAAEVLGRLLDAGGEKYWEQALR